MAGQIKVLIIDDSAMMRKIIKQILETDPAITVVGTARDGQDGLNKDQELSPDVVVLDINMPVMDGLTCMVYLFEQHKEVQVVMLSSLTQEGALTTFEALELGAFDYVGKPSGTVSSNLYIVGRELIDKVKAAAACRRRKKTGTARPRLSAKPSPAAPAPRQTAGHVQNVVVIGVSTGGPATLMDILPGLPAGLNAAVLIIQHMPPSFTNSFAKRLNEYTPLSVREAKAGDKLAPGSVLVAPGGFHTLVRKHPVSGECCIRLSQYPEDCLFIPSVDVTMQSALEVFGRRTIGVLLTGMGCDGAAAMVKVREAGGWTIAEDKSTAVVFGMPREAIERGGAEVVAPSHQIAKEIVRAVGRLSLS